MRLDDEQFEQLVELLERNVHHTEAVAEAVMGLTSVISNVNENVITLGKIVAAIEANTKPSNHQAVSAAIITGGVMPGQITVDTTNETATIEFLDDHGDVATAPDGAVVAFASDNDAVATVAVDPANPLQGDITPVSVGTANISVTISDSSGNPLLEADGTTPFPVPAPVAVTVSAGPAATDELVLSV